MTRPRFLRSAALVALALAGLTGPALADAQMAEIGAALGLTAEPGGTVRRDAGGRLTVSGFEAQGPAYALTASRLVLDPGDGMTAFVAEGLSVGGADGQTGFLVADRFEGGDVSVLRALLENTLMVQPCEGEGFEVPFRAQGISLLADDGMSAGAVREETRLDAVDATFLMGAGCSQLVALDVQGFAARGVGSSVAHATRLTYASNPGRAGAMTLTAEGLVAASSQGAPIVTAAQVVLQSSLTRPLGEILAAGEALPAELLAEARTGLLVLTLEDLDTDLSALLPGRVPAGHQLQGDFDLRIEGGEDTRLHLATEMAGLGDIRAEASLLADPAVNVAGGPAALAMGLRIEEGELSVRDRGLDRILAASTGQGLSGLLAEALTEVQGSLPAMASGRLAPVFEAMIAWTDSAVARGGSVTIAPRDPVSLAQIAMASIQGVVGLTQTLGVTTGPAR